jgi:hypothetical protein
MTSSNPSIEMPSIEEIRQLVTFTRIGDEWQVNTVLGNVGGNVEGSVWGNVEGSVWGNVEGSVLGNVWGNVEGNVGGNVWGNVGGNVVGNVGGNVGGNVVGTINGRNWSYELTLKERIQNAIKSGDTDLTSKLLEGAEVTAKD